jgi:hypothetical protein
MPFSRSLRCLINNQRVEVYCEVTDAALTTPPSDCDDLSRVNESIPL